MAKPNAPIATSLAGTPPETPAVLADRLSHLIAMSRGLILGGRVVDLEGLRERMGVLSAQILDLGQEDARAMLPSLYEIMAQLDELGAVLPDPGEH